MSDNLTLLNENDDSDLMLLSVSQDYHDAMSEAAAVAGMSVEDFIAAAVREEMQRRNWPSFLQ